MNSERELFEDHYKKLFGDIGFDYLKTDGSYSNDMKNNMWLSWQASAQRQGYKLVPVETIQHAIGWSYVAKWDSAFEEDEKNIKHHENILRATIGAFDDDH